jgi:hypothetical protein
VSSPPVRYENYPPEQNGAPATPVLDDATPVAEPGPPAAQQLTARLLIEAWINETGAELLVVRILTAKPESDISAQAQQVVDEFSEGF